MARTTLKESAALSGASPSKRKNPFKTALYGAAAVVLGLGVALVGVALPASAHVYSQDVTCAEWFVDLTLYDSAATAEVTLDGASQHSGTFGGTLHLGALLGDNANHTLTVVVVSTDGDQWNVDYSKTTEGCYTPPPTPASGTAEIVCESGVAVVYTTGDPGDNPATFHTEINGSEVDGETVSPPNTYSYSEVMSGLVDGDQLDVLLTSGSTTLASASVTINCVEEPTTVYPSANKVDECGTSGDYVVAGPTAGIDYVINYDNGTVTATPQNDTFVLATLADSGWVLNENGTATWWFTFDDAPCVVAANPGASMTGECNAGVFEGNIALTNVVEVNSEEVGETAEITVTIDGVSTVHQVPANTVVNVPFSFAGESGNHTVKVTAGDAVLVDETVNTDDCIVPPPPPKTPPTTTSLPNTGIDSTGPLVLAGTLVFLGAVSLMTTKLYGRKTALAAINK